MKKLVFCLLGLVSAFLADADAASLDGTAASADSASLTERVDSSAVFRVDEIRYRIGDALDDSRTHTKYDKWLADFMNWVHVETREATVHKLLFFDKGDLVNLNLFLEAERFLREQKFLSDAAISVTEENGKNIVNVQTSDNWTLVPLTTLGFAGDDLSFDNLIWGLGIRESNFLGLGQELGFYYGRDQFRSMWQASYADPHFLFRYNHLDFLYSYNTDGYLASWKMYVPFLSRSANQWAYTLEGLKNKRNAIYYGRGELPPGAKTYDFKQNKNFLAQLEKVRKDPSNKKKSEHQIDSMATDKYLKSLSRYNGKNSVKIMEIEDFITDSLSFRLSRSFGGTQRKIYLGATYDYLREAADENRIDCVPFTDGERVYTIDSAIAYNEWVQDRKDSRLGFYVKYSDLRYEKIRNYHNVKWTEDVEKGFSVKAQISKNYEQLGAANNDIRLDFWTDLYLGREFHHLTLNSFMNFYLDHGKRHDFYGRVQGEYLFHPSNRFSTVLSGSLDAYDRAKYGYQLTLGNSEGLSGVPEGFYSGQARVYGKLEQRWFPDFEILTLMPVFVAYMGTGETAARIKDFNRKDLSYEVGFGIRLVQTKSISRLVNKIDLVVPLNGVRRGRRFVSITTSYSL